MAKRTCRRWIPLSLMLAIFASAGLRSVADDPWRAHARAGEFGVARHMTGGVSDPAAVGRTIAGLRGSSVLNLTSAPLTESLRGSPVWDAGDRSTGGQGPFGGGVPAAGGGAMADYSALMQLIQTTVVPDTWEALGGPSTMFPYAQGIVIDPDGAIRSAESMPADDVAADLRAELSALQSRPGEAASVDHAIVAPDAWRLPSPLRFVSLRRWLAEARRREMSGHRPGTSMAFLAGLSEVRQVILMADGDVILAGPVGGVIRRDGWFRDARSGAALMTAESFALCIDAALHRRPLRCTIDPTADGLARAVELGARVGTPAVPLGTAADRLAEALGPQRVEVFGTPAGTPTAALLVEADRHMKQLALGDQPMPAGLRNYLDFVASTIAQGPPSGVLLRLWFAPRPQRVRAWETDGDDASRVYELTGRPIRLSHENQRALADGGRGDVVTDSRAAAFVDEFNRNWTAIRDRYPIYAALETIYHSAAVAEVMQRFGNSPAHQALAESFAATVSASILRGPEPRQVDSLATLRSVRHGRKIHHIVVASGGVLIRGGQLISATIEAYPRLKQYAQTAGTQPAPRDRWWWDVESLTTDD